MLGKGSKELRNILAQRFISALEESPKTWKQSWISNSTPMNGLTKKRYTGLNALWLQGAMIIDGYNDPRFFTFKQASKEGYKIKKGSEGYKVEFWSLYDKENRKIINNAEADILKAEGNGANIIMLSRTYTVFNAEQIEGVPELNQNHYSTADNNVIIKSIAKNMGVQIFNNGGDQSFYRPATDTIHLPETKYFKSQEGYNAVMLHELGHATGAEHRLNRQIKNTFGSEAYAKEELVAEITSCFTMSELGLSASDIEENQMNNHIAYVQSWIAQLKEQPDTLFEAIKKASEATDYIVKMKELGIEKNKDYVSEFLENFYVYKYDEKSADEVYTSELPQYLLSDEIKQGGIDNDIEKCKKFIVRDGEAAYNTEYYIKDNYPEQNIDSINDPGLFSLIMMERELYKAIGRTDLLDKWDEKILLTEEINEELLTKNGVNYDALREMKTELNRAKNLLNEYCNREFGNDADFSDLHRIGIAYTEVDGKSIQVNLDLIKCSITTYVDNEIIEEQNYNSLNDLNNNALEWLDFDNLIAIDMEDEIEI